MTTAIIGVGNIGKTVAQHLVNGGESVVLAASDLSDAETLANELGDSARAAPVNEAIANADAVVLAVWFDVIKELIVEHADLLAGKVVVDPSNPITVDDNGQYRRTLPDGTSAGTVIADMLPPAAHYVKAFGTLTAQSLASGANRTPRRVALFYATDDEQAAASVERLISAAGFDPVKVGGVNDALRIEMYGDLHEIGGLNGKLLDADEARAAVAAVPA
jgi:predicted dinucleotide-binding enzyme